MLRCPVIPGTRTACCQASQGRQKCLAESLQPGGVSWGLGGLCLGRTWGFEVPLQGLRALSACAPLLCTLRNRDEEPLAALTFPHCSKKSTNHLRPQIHSKQEPFLFTSWGGGGEEALN